MKLKQEVTRITNDSCIDSSKLRNFIENNEKKGKMNSDNVITWRYRIEFMVIGRRILHFAYYMYSVYLPTFKFQY